ncbi:hypothetical protein V6Z12_D08G182600 [Gossypium hirsutum]
MENNDFSGTDDCWERHFKKDRSPHKLFCKRIVFRSLHIPSCLHMYVTFQRQHRCSHIMRGQHAGFKVT